MACKFDPNKLSQKDRDFLFNKININSTDFPDSGHLLWKNKSLNKPKNGYPRMRLEYLEEVMGITCGISPAHILYAIRHNIVLNDETKDLSHLCHETRCISPNHVNYEPKAVNTQRRDICVKKRICDGHYLDDVKNQFPKCIFT